MEETRKWGEVNTHDQTDRWKYHVLRASTNTPEDGRSNQKGLDQNDPTECPEDSLSYRSLLRVTPAQDRRP